MDPTTVSMFNEAVRWVGTSSVGLLPDPDPGVTALWIPPKLSLQTFRGSAVGHEVMSQWDWYDKHPWSWEALRAGRYRLQIPVPGSSLRTADEQMSMLPEGEEELASVLLVVTALVCKRLRDGVDPLRGGSTRCAERTAHGEHIEVKWLAGRIYVSSGWNGYRGSDLWASSVRTS